MNSVKAEYLKDPNRFRRVRLDREWVQSNHYKEAAWDFRKVLGVGVYETPPVERPDFKPYFGLGTSLFSKPYLVDLKDFVAVFGGVSGLKAAKHARVLIGMPGFPKNSFYYHSYDGEFGDFSHSGLDFNRMYVVTDNWDQVVAVQFTCEDPSYLPRLPHEGIGIFNFVQFRRKGTTSALVRFARGGDHGETVIRTTLEDSGGPKEMSILFLPAPTREMVSFALTTP